MQQNSASPSRSSVRPFSSLPFPVPFSQPSMFPSSSSSIPLPQLAAMLQNPQLAPLVPLLMSPLPPFSASSLIDSSAAFPSSSPQAEEQVEEPSEDLEALLEHSLRASLVDLVDKRILAQLRDDRKIIGILRTFDQFANVVLEKAVERKIYQNQFADVPLGIFIIRGENVTLLGELVCALFIHLSLSGSLLASFASVVYFTFLLVSS